MNVRLRFLGVATLVSLVSATTSLAAQSAVQPCSGDAATSVAPATSPSLLAAERAARNAPADSAPTVARGPSVASARVAVHQVSTSRGAAPVIQNRIMPVSVTVSGTPARAWRRNSSDALPALASTLTSRTAQRWPPPSRAE